MKEELYNNGPYEAVITVYQDLLTYKSGVYYYQSGQYIGYHWIMVIGWGNVSSMDYW